MAHKRTRHTPSRFQDFVATERKEPTKSQVLYTIVLHTNEEEHTVPLEALENTTGLPLQKEEAVIDQEVVWLHKGKIPYKATIVGSQSSNMGKCSRRGQGAKNGGVSTAKRADLDVDEEVTDDDITKRNSIPPSDVSDEEQEPTIRDTHFRKDRKGSHGDEGPVISKLPLSKHRKGNHTEEPVIRDTPIRKDRKGSHGDEELIIRETPLSTHRKGSHAEEPVIRDTPRRKRNNGSDSDDEDLFITDSPLHKRRKGSNGDSEEPQGRPSSFSTSDRALLIAIDRRLRALEEMLSGRGNSSKINVQSTISKSSRTALTVPEEGRSTVKEETSFCSDGGVDFHLLTGATPDKYALNLMDSLFTDDEMRGHLFFKSTRSKSTRELLPQDRVKKLLAAVAARFGKEETRKNFDKIQKKLNQKCRDKDKSESAADKENLFESFDL